MPFLARSSSAARRAPPARRPRADRAGLGRPPKSDYTRCPIRARGRLVGRALWPSTARGRGQGGTRTRCPIRAQVPGAASGCRARPSGPLRRARRIRLSASCRTRERPYRAVQPAPARPYAKNGPAPQWAGPFGTGGPGYFAPVTCAVQSAIRARRFSKRSPRSYAWLTEFPTLCAMARSIVAW